MNAFDVLAEPVRRRILEVLVDGELSSGEIVSVVEREFAVSQGDSGAVHGEAGDGRSDAAGCRDPGRTGSRL